MKSLSFVAAVALLLFVSCSAKELVGCDCEGSECGCCQHVSWHQVHIDTEICLNISYNPRQLSISLTLTVGHDTLLNETVSARNPDVCVGLPWLHKVASLCIGFQNLSYSSSHLSGCVEISAELLGVTVERVQLGCFSIHVMKEHGAPAIAEQQREVVVLRPLRINKDAKIPTPAVPVHHDDAHHEDADHGSKKKQKAIAMH